MVADVRAKSESLSHHDCKTLQQRSHQCRSTAAALVFQRTKRQINPKRIYTPVTLRCIGFLYFGRSVPGSGFQKIGRYCLSWDHGETDRHSPVRYMKRSCPTSNRKSCANTWVVSEYQPTLELRYTTCRSLNRDYRNASSMA